VPASGGRTSIYSGKPRSGPSRKNSARPCIHGWTCGTRASLSAALQEHAPLPGRVPRAAVPGAWQPLLHRLAGRRRRTSVGSLTSMPGRMSGNLFPFERMDQFGAHQTRPVPSRPAFCSGCRTNHRPAECRRCRESGPRERLAGRPGSSPPRRATGLRANRLSSIPSECCRTGEPSIVPPAIELNDGDTVNRTSILVQDRRGRGKDSIVPNPLNEVETAPIPSTPSSSRAPRPRRPP
jgi:hypothetical protein